MKKTTLAVLLLSTLTASAAFAGTTGYSLVSGTGSDSNTETRAYAGLSWNLGGGTTPALVLGMFRADVEADGDTTGGNLAFHMDLSGGPKPGKLKLGYLNGRNNFQGEIGIGYDFLKQAPLLGLGINAPYLNAGVDMYSNPGFVPYGTVHTQRAFDKPNNNAAQCVPNSTTATYSDPACTVPLVVF